MRLLIVEDNSALAELTARLLYFLDRPRQSLEAITLAADLHTAMLCLPEHDAVLCDGMFPLCPEAGYAVEQWDVVRQEAHRRGIHFVLYSGSASALDCARESNTAAIAKPAAAEEIYAALTRSRVPVIAKSPTSRVPVAEDQSSSGEHCVPINR
jgi:CheY-like chemotaxis protein